MAHIMASNNDNLKYDYCWQLDKWDLPDNGDKSFEALHYHALKYINQNNIDSAFSMINEARLTVIDSLSCSCLESTETIYTPLTKLKIIEVSITIFQCIALYYNSHYIIGPGGFYLYA